MAASGVQARQGAIWGPPGAVVFGRGGSASLSGVGWGSEFGSSIYRQFGPRHSQGAWLYPAGRDDATVEQMEQGYIDQAISKATGGH